MVGTIHYDWKTEGGVSGGGDGFKNRGLHILNLRCVLVIQLEILSSWLYIEV